MQNFSPVENRFFNGKVENIVRLAYFLSTLTVVNYEVNAMYTGVKLLKIIMVKFKI